MNIGLTIETTSQIPNILCVTLDGNKNKLAQQIFLVNNFFLLSSSLKLAPGLGSRGI